MAVAMLRYFFRKEAPSLLFPRYPFHNKYCPEQVFWTEAAPPPDIVPGKRESIVLILVGSADAL